VVAGRVGDGVDDLSASFHGSNNTDCIAATAASCATGAHAILRGANGRRHEVDFGEAEVTIEVYAGETTIEIVIEAPHDLSHRKRFALLNVPRDQFSAALGHAAQRKSANKTRPVT
jgi:hypothetical protein